MPAKPSSRGIYAAAGAALLLLVAGVVGSYLNTQALITANGNVGHTYQVLAQLNSILFDLTSAESAERAYVASGQTLYLGTYYQSAANIKSDLANVRSLAADNPTQLQRLDQVEPLANQRLADLKTVIDKRASAGLNPALVLMTDGNSQGVLVTLRAQVNAMINTENQLLASRSTRSDVQTQIASLTLIAVSVVSFGLLAGIIFLLGREVRQRRQTEISLAAESRLLNSLMDAVPDTIYFKDSQSRFTRVNRAQAAVLGIQRPEDAVGKRDTDFFSGPLSESFLDEEKTILVSGQPILDRAEFNPLPNGQPRWFAATKVPLIDSDGKITGLVGISRNITQRRQAEAELEQSNTALQHSMAEVERHNREISLFNDLLDLMQTCETSLEAYSALMHAIPKLLPGSRGALFIVNSSQTSAEAVGSWGEPLTDSEQIFAPHDCWALRRSRAYWVTDGVLTPACKHVAAPDGQAAYGCLPISAQGETFGVLHIRFGSGPAEAGAPDGAEFAAQRRVTESLAEQLALGLANLKLREKLRDQSIRDPLTGLFNRRYLEESLERESARARRRQSPVSILMLDLDHFKQFNDNFGHEAGDLLLREFGHFLRRYCRDEDIACRFGGEEFVVLLADTTAIQARARAEALRAGVKGLFVELRGQPLGAVTVSIGLATLPDDGLAIENVIRQADAALYRAKNNGRDQVQAAETTPTLNTPAAE